MVIIVAPGTIVNIMVLAIKAITAININSIRENIMVTIAIDRDNTTSVVTGLITIESMDIIGIDMTRAIRTSLCL